MIEVAVLMPCLAVALAASASTLLILRAAASTGQAATSVRLPWFISAFRWPSGLLAPTISLMMTSAQEERLAGLLDAQGLVPGVTPAQWVATRLVHAMLCASATLVLGGLDQTVLAVLAGAAGYLSGGSWMRRVERERERRIERELPGYLDLLTVCVEAGATLTAGIRLVVAAAPESPLRSYFDRVLREVRGGRTRAEAFSHVARVFRVESLSTLANALSHAETAGMSLGQILRTQATQRTAERFARAEKLAMQAPVKMLGPLIFCIFPCTFIVLAVPISVRLLEVLRA